jgi:hypothetical protein
MGCGWRRLRAIRLALQGRSLRPSALSAPPCRTSDAPAGRCGHDHRPVLAAQRVDECEDAGHRADRPVESQLAEHADLVEHPVRELARGGDETEGDGELESGACLADTTRREVDRDPLLGELEVRRQQCRAHALA